MFIFTNKTSKLIENHFHLFRHHNFGFATISRNPFPILSCFFWSESSFLWFPNNNNRISFRFYFYSKWNSLCWRSFSMVFVASDVRFGLFFLFVCLFVCVFFWWFSFGIGRRYLINSHLISSTDVCGRPMGRCLRFGPILAFHYRNSNNRPAIDTMTSSFLFSSFCFSCCCCCCCTTTTQPLPKMYRFSWIFQ